MPKYDQKSTFDRKVLESPILNQNDCNRNFKIFHWAVCTNRLIALKKLFHYFFGKAFGFEQLLQSRSNCFYLEQLL